MADPTDLPAGDGGRSCMKSRHRKTYGVNIGTNGSPNTHVLIVDREEKAAYFAQEWEAESFIRLHRQNVAA